MIELSKKENVIIAKINLSNKIVNQAKFKSQQLVDKKRNKNINLKEEQKKHYLDMFLLFKGLTELFLYLNNNKILLENMIGVINSFKTNLTTETPIIEIEYYSGKKIDNFITKLPKELLLKYLKKSIHLRYEDDENLTEIIDEMLSSPDEFLLLSGNVITPALIELNNLSYSKNYVDKLRLIINEVFLKNNLSVKKNDGKNSLIPDDLIRGLLYKDYLWLIISQQDKYHFPIEKKEIDVLPEKMFELATPSSELNIFITFNFFINSLQEIKCYRHINTFFEESIPNEFMLGLQNYEQYGENAWWYQINDKMDRSKSRGTGFADQMQDGISLWYKSKYGKELPDFDNIKLFEELFAQYMEDWNKVATERQNDLTPDDILKRDVIKIQYEFEIETAAYLIKEEGIDAFNKQYDVNLPSDILNPFWKETEIDFALKKLKSSYPNFLTNYFSFIAKIFEIGKKIENNYSLANFIKVHDEISKKFTINKILKDILNDLIFERIVDNVAKTPKLYGIAHEYKNPLNNIIESLFDTAVTHIKNYFYTNIYFKKLINELIKIFSVFNVKISSDEIYDRFVNLQVYSNISAQATNAKKKNAKLFIIPEKFKELFRKLEIKTGKFATLNDIVFTSTGAVFPTYDKQFNEEYFLFNIEIKNGKNDEVTFLLEEDFYNEVITCIPKKWINFIDSVKNVDSNYDKFINFLVTDTEKNAFNNSKNVKLSEASLENYKKFIMSLKKYI